MQESSSAQKTLLPFPIQMLLRYFVLERGYERINEMPRSRTKECEERRIQEMNPIFFQHIFLPECSPCFLVTGFYEIK
jgi:hypothetical protein